MGYLRGTRSMVPFRAARPYNSRLRTEINELRRKINKQKPERKHFSTSFTSLCTPATTTSTQVDISDSLHGWNEFRDNVLGDKWVNHMLTVSIMSDSDLPGAVRLIVYKPKRVGNALAINQGFTQIIDPNDHVVYYDRVISKASTYSAKATVNNIKIPLRSTITCWDNLVRSGDIRLALVVVNDATTRSILMTTRYMLTYSNK